MKVTWSKFVTKAHCRRDVLMSLCGWGLISDVFMNSKSCKLPFADFLMLMTRLMKALRFFSLLSNILLLFTWRFVILC